MSLLKYSELNDRNAPRPALPSYFQRELDDICRSFNVRLRLVWAPDREQREMIGYKGNKTGFIGKVYGQNPPCYDVRHLGWWVVRSQGESVKAPDMTNVLRHEGPFALPRRFNGRATSIHYDSRNDVWWVPEWKKDEVSYNRWLFEQRLSDAERDTYEAKTFDPDSFELVQELAWPSDGLWVAMGPFLADHNPLCCDEANRLGALCPGRYRDPCRADLEAIREAIRQRNADGMWNGVDGDQSRAIAEITRKRLELHTLRDAERQAHYRASVSNKIAPILSKLNPTIIGGVGKPQHTKPFDLTDLTKG